MTASGPSRRPPKVCFQPRATERFRHHAPKTPLFSSLLVAIERRLLQIQSAQRRPEHLVVDPAGVALGDERGALGLEHLEPEASERRCGALADLVVAATELFPRRVAAAI